MSRSTKFVLALVAVAAVVMPKFALASINIDINQVGTDVVATVSGSFDYSSLIPQESGTSNFLSYSAANDALFGLSNPNPSGAVAWIKWRIDEQAPYTTPFWGDGSSAGNLITAADSTTGVGTLLLEGNPLASPGTNEARLRLPLSYVANSSLAGTATWSNKTLAQLGLQTSGTWQWQSAAGDFVTLQINAVPEPATCTLVAAGLIGLFVKARRKA